MRRICTNFSSLVGFDPLLIRSICVIRVLFCGSAAKGSFHHKDHKDHKEKVSVHSLSPPLGDVFFKALGGASPMLAPGMLAVAATYYHPVLARSSGDV